MPQISLPFATQEGESSVQQNSRETLINMFAEIEISARQRLIRIQRPGLSSSYAVTGAKRCIERFGIYHYLVIDTGFYRFDGTTLTLLGSLTSSQTRCSMVFDDNGNILISDGANAFYWNGTTLSYPVFPTAVGPVAFMAGYGIYPVPNSATFYVTGLNAMNTVDALDFATAESNPDNLVRIFTDHNELWLFGTRSTEVWSLSGAADFPFTPYVNAQMERGCRAAFSVASEDNTLFWLGDDDIVYRADGYRPVRVSTHPIERQIADIPEAARALADAFFYTHDGHKFYTLRFPGYFTLQYNIATGFWNRAKTYLHDDWVVTGSAGRVTDYLMTDAGIARLVDRLSTDEGAPMQRAGISAPIYADGRDIALNMFRLDCEVGRAPEGVEPVISLRIARDGETFGNERSRSLGLTGDYRRKVTWRGCGMGKEIAVQFSMTDNATLAIMGADGELSAGR